MSSKLKIPNNILVDLNPYGIFNRLSPTYTEDFYQENGMIDRGILAFRRPEAYLPGTYFSNKELCPITGPLSFVLEKRKTREVDLSDPAPDPTNWNKTFIRSGVHYSVTFSNQAIFGMESKALGCENKTNELDIEDPKGPGKDCYMVPHSVIPPYFPLTMTPGAPGVMIEAFIAGQDAIWAAKRAGGIEDVCQERDVSVGTIVEEEKIYCQNLASKKMAVYKIPASVFSGKMRLFVQSVYGSNYLEYNYKEQNGGAPWLEVGKNLKYYYDKKYEPSEFRSRFTFLVKGQHVCLRDEKFNYFILNSSMCLNWLEPSKKARALRNHLEEESDIYTPEELSCLEAYILGHSYPTAYSNAISGIDAALVGFNGSPLDFGWHGNNSGDEIARVSIAGIDNHSKSRIEKITFSFDGLDDLVEAENQRKYDSLLFQMNSPEIVAKGNLWVFQGVYLTKKTYQNSEGNDQEVWECDSDLEDGCWIFAREEVADDAGSPEEVAAMKEAAEKEWKSQNKQWGGLSRSKEFFQSLQTAVSFDVETSEEEEFDTLWQMDKLFKYDEYNGAYMWYWTRSDPRFYMKDDFDGQCNAPIYCWYDTEDQLRILYYQNRGPNEYDQDNWNDPPLCGSGERSSGSTSEKDPSGSHSTFYVTPLGTEIKSYRGGFSRHETKETVGGSQGLEGDWGATCGCGGCDGTATDAPTPFIPYFYSNWYKTGWGQVTIDSLLDSGHKNGFACAIIPRLDAEGVYLAKREVITHTGSHTVTTYERPVETSNYWISNLFPVEISTEDGGGWLTCSGAYFARMVGRVVVDGHMVKDCDFFSYNNTLFSRGTGPWKMRKWGPGAGDTVCYYGPIMSEQYRNDHQESKHDPELQEIGYAKYIGKKEPITLVSELDLEGRSFGEFYPFCDVLSLKFPWVMSNFTSISSYGGISQIPGGPEYKTCPEKIPFPPVAETFVGAV
jgi:hypothetical protein